MMPFEDTRAAEWPTGTCPHGITSWDGKTVEECMECHAIVARVVEAARLDAVMRMLVDSGDMTPMAVRQIKLMLGFISAVADA